MNKLKTEEIRDIVNDLESGKIVFEPPSMIGFNIIKLLAETVTRLERHESRYTTNDWIDEWGSCKVCGGEIPLGHLPDCAYYALESVLKDTVESHRELNKKLLKSLDNEADAISRETDRVEELTESIAVQRQMVKLLEQRRVRIHELKEQLNLADDINDCLRSSQTNEEIENLERKLKLHKRTIEKSTEHADWLSSVLMQRDDEITKLKSQLPDGMEDCTLEFKECPVGHGWLTATNWEQHDGCRQCDTVEAHRLLTKHVRPKW